MPSNNIIKMYAPAGTSGIIHASKTQQTYTIAGDGSVLVDPNDVAALTGAGFTTAPRLATSANGLYSPTHLRLIDFKNLDGTTLAAAASAGKFGLSDTPGTSEGLTGEAAQGNTKTDDAMTEFQLPSNYVAGQNINVVVNAKYAGAGTPGTKTVVAKAYRKLNDGTESANLIATAAQAVTTSPVDYTFVITGTTLVPGDVVAIVVEAVLQETGGSSTVTETIDSVRLG